MKHLPTLRTDENGAPFSLRRLRPPLPFFLLQPLLGRIVRRIGTSYPDMFERLGPHKTASFLIDPINLPFVLLLRPNPENLGLRAHSRAANPPHDASISGKFLNLLQLIDGELDGDALFFSRDLVISGNTEAIVCLRNALDDVDGSVAEMVAEMLGTPGKTMLKIMRRAITNPKLKADK